MIEDMMRETVPHTLNALQGLVMAMASVNNNVGKKTLFGRDKGRDAYGRFLKALKVTLHAMVLDRVVTEATSPDDVVEALEKQLFQFKLAFPNWQDAYRFAGMFFDERRKDATVLVAQLRFMP